MVRARSVAPAPVLCDLDGVVWLAREPIPGSVEAIHELRRRGHRLLFVTNNSAPRVADHVAALEAIGVPEAEVLTSAMAAGSLVATGQRVLVVGGPGLAEAVERRRARVVDVPPADVVLVGFHRDFGFDVLACAASAVRDGARLIGANDDPTYPTPDGLIPGGGAILAAIATAGGAIPTIAGKPHDPMVRLVAHALGSPGRRAWPQVWVVGDRASTDGRFARRLGARYGQVRTGVAEDENEREWEAQVRPDAEAACLAALVPSLSDTMSPMAGTAPTDLVKKLLDAGAQFTEMTQQRAERLVRELSTSGELRRKDAEKLVSELVERGRDTTEGIVQAVQRVVEEQLARLGGRVDDVEAAVDELAAKVGISLPGRSSKRTAPATPAAPQAPAKKGAAKKAAAKKAAAKSDAAKKAPSRKSGTSTSGVRKVTTGRKSS